MRNRILLVTGMTALIGAAAAWSLAWATPQDKADRLLMSRRWEHHFGMVTLAPGQTARINLFVSRFSAGPSDLPPGPIRVKLAFLDAEGRLIGDPQTRTLQDGVATLLDFTFDGEAADRAPRSIRASAWIEQDFQQGDRTTPPDPCSTLEVLDTVTGRGALHLLPAVQRVIVAAPPIR